MKQSVKDSIFIVAKLLVYYVAYQLLFRVAAMVGAIIFKVATKDIDSNTINQLIDASNGSEAVMPDAVIWGTAIGLFLSAAMMLWHLIHFGYFKFGKEPMKQVKGNIMLLSIVLIFCAMTTFNICAQWVELPDNLEMQMQQLSNNIIGILAIAVIAPILEEVLFRGAIQGYLMRHFENPWVGIIAASLIFGIIHMNPIQIFYATFLGLVFGWIYYRTGSLMPVIIGHVLNNSLAALTMLLGIEEEDIAIGDLNEKMTIIICIAIAICAAYLINKKQPSVPQPWHGAGEEETLAIANENATENTEE